MFDTAPHGHMDSRHFQKLHAAVHFPLRSIRHPGAQESRTHSTMLQSTDMLPISTSLELDFWCHDQRESRNTNISTAREDGAPHRMATASTCGPAQGTRRPIANGPDFTFVRYITSVRWHAPVAAAGQARRRGARCRTAAPRPHGAARPTAAGRKSQKPRKHVQQLRRRRWTQSAW